jgi:hypothetical protein
MSLPLTTEQQAFLDALTDRVQEFKQAYSAAVRNDNDPPHVSIVEQAELNLALRRASANVARAVTEILAVAENGSVLQVPRVPATRGSLSLTIPEYRVP